MSKTLEQLLANESPEFMAKAQQKANTMRLNIHLALLRKQLQLTQMELASCPLLTSSFQKQAISSNITGQKKSIVDLLVMSDDIEFEPETLSKQIFQTVDLNPWD